MGWSELIDKGSAKNSASPTVRVPRGRYDFFHLSLEGTTDTAQTLDPSDVGTIRLQRQGRQKQGESFEFYHDLSGIKGGFVEATTPTAGATRVVAFIPLAFPGIPNTMDVLDDEELRILLDFKAILDTRFGTNDATWRLWGHKEPAVPERYELLVETEDIQVSGAGSTPKPLSGLNIGAIYLRDSADVVDSVQIEQDEATVVKNIDDVVLLDLTNVQNRVESSGNDLVEVNLAASGLISETQNKTTKITPDFNASGTLELIKFRVVMGNSDTEGSRSRVQRYLQAKQGQGRGIGNNQPAGAFGSAG